MFLSLFPETLSLNDKPEYFVSVAEARERNILWLRIAQICEAMGFEWPTSPVDTKTNTINLRRDLRRYGKPDYAKALLFHILSYYRIQHVCNLHGIAIEFDSIILLQ